MWIFCSKVVSEEFFRRILKASPLTNPFLTLGRWHEVKCVCKKVSVCKKCVFASRIDFSLNLVPCLETIRILESSKEKMFSHSQPHCFGKSHWKPVFFRENRSLSIESRLPRQWKAKESGFMKICFQMYKWTGKTYQLPFWCTTETKFRFFSIYIYT